MLINQEVNMNNTWKKLAQVIKIGKEMLKNGKSPEIDKIVPERIKKGGNNFIQQFHK